MSQSPGTGTSQPLGTTTGRMAAIRLKSANKYIFRALISLASANLLIRLMGMLNQVVVTARFGQGSAMDAYFVAATLPTTLAQLLASGLEASVIPVYTRVRTKQGKQAASRLFSTLMNILLISVGLITVTMIVFRNQMILFSAPSLQSSSHILAVNLTLFIFPVLIFMTLNSFMECILNTEGQFGWPAYAGMLVPITTMTLVVIGGKTVGVLMLCIGTLVGQIFQLCAIAIRARRAKIAYQFVLDLRSPEIAMIGMVAWPALFSALISQASPLVDQMFASALSAGSIAVLNNALKLISVPVGVIFSSVGRAALPYLASQAAIKDMKAFKETLRLYLWAVGIGTLVLSSGLILLAHPIVELLFQHGAFSEEDTSRTATTLIGFAIGLTPMAFGFITSRAFSALGKTKVLMYVTLFSIIANAIFDYIFARIWQSFGIALSTSAVYACTMFILLFTLRATIGKLYLFTPPNEFLKLLWRFGMGEYYVRWLIWKQENFHNVRLPYGLRKNITRALIILAVFLGGIIGSIFNSLYTVRVAFGSIIILLFLRYNYLLLLTWVLINAFIGSNLSFFSGQNFLSGLIAPTVILLFVLPTKAAFKQMPALPFFLAFVVWVLLGFWLSPLPASTFFMDWTILLTTIAVMVLAISTLTSRRRIHIFIDAILLVATFIALYGIEGYFTKQNGVLDTATSFFRISSIFGSTPPIFAMFLSIVIPLVIYRTFTLQGWWRLIGAVVLTIFLAALGLTFTRAAFISVPVSMVIMIVCLPSRRLRLSLIGGMLAVGGLVVLVATIGNTPIFSRFFNQDLTTLNGRTYLWAAIIGHFDPAQLLGRGLKASDALLGSLHVGVGFGVIATVAHNIYLETLYDNGIIGLILLLLTFAFIVLPLFGRLRHATPEYRMLLSMTFAIFFNVVVQSFDTNDLWNPSVGIYFWLIMTLPFVLYWKNTWSLSQPVAASSSDLSALWRNEEDEQAHTKQLTHV